jgi:pyrimidine deaminase RibD-like protein
MSEQEIFEYLFEISTRSDDVGGVVTSCLVRDSKVLVDGVSSRDGRHSEYVVLQNLKSQGLSVLPEDTLYTTVEPCGRRSIGGPGEKMGDCTTNIINAGVKRVVYAAADPDASEQTRHKFITAKCRLEQVQDKAIVRRAVQLFNSTVTGVHEPLPENQ